MTEPGSGSAGTGSAGTGSWWRGTRLVAGRILAEGVTSRGWRLVTALLLVGGIAIAVVPRLLGDNGTTYTLATVGPAPAGLVTQLHAASEAGHFTVDYAVLGDTSAVQQSVRDGSADVGLAAAQTGQPSQIFVQRAGVGSFPALVSGAVRAQATVDSLLAAGLTADQVAAVERTPVPEEVVVGPVTDEGRAAVGFVAGIVLYLALILSGTGIATAVATEKATRVTEVLLAVLRPTQLLVGTVLGVGLLALVQISALAVPAGVSLARSTVTTLPPEAATDIALAVCWFVLGLCLYAFVFAALAALVDKVTEVNSAIMPVNFVLIGSYLVGVVVVQATPEGWVATAASLFPLSAPLVMPARWAAGVVPVWQLVLAMALTAATAVLLARLASAIYRRGVVRTGQRVSLRDLVRSGRGAGPA